MIVDLDTKHRIRSNNECWVLEVQGISKGKETWKGLGYYSSFESAVRGAIQREIRTTHTHGLDESIAAAEAVAEKYRGLLDPVVQGG